MTARWPRLLGVLLMGIFLLSSQQCGMPPWRPAPATGERRCAGSAPTGHLVIGDGGLPIAPPMWRRRGAGAASSWGCRRLASSTVPTRSPSVMQLISATVAPWPPMLEIARTAGHRRRDGPACGSHPTGLGGSSCGGAQARCGRPVTGAGTPRADGDRTGRSAGAGSASPRGRRTANINSAATRRQAARKANGAAESAPPRTPTM